MPISALGRRAVAAAAVSLFAALAARADLTVVSATRRDGGPARVNGSRQQSASALTQTTSYFKGNKLRTDSGSSITLTDLATGESIHLDRAKKTYYLSRASDAINAAIPFLDALEFSVEGEVAPGGQTKTIVGKEARNFTVALTVSVTAKKDAALPLPQEAGSGPLFTMTLQGEHWTTDAVDAAAAGAPNAASRLMQSNPLFRNVKALGEKLAVIKGFGLESSMTMTMKSALPIPGMDGAKPLVVKTQTLSLREDPLADDLFALPKGFKKVEPPAPGGLGGGF